MTIPETETAPGSSENTNDPALTPTTTKTDEGQPQPVAMSYKQAKYLAASERRDGEDSYAVFKPSSSQWYVKHIK